MMRKQADHWLFGAALWLLLLAIIASLVIVQWRHSALPVAAIAAVLGLTILKGRIVIKHYMGLRNLALTLALTSWVGLFALVALAKALAPVLFH